VNDGKIDSAVNLQSTIRNCYGINRFNSEGFILPLWAEHSIITNKGDIHLFASHDNRVEYHGIDLYRGALDPFHVFKLHSPWEFYCNKDIKWLLTQNYYAMNSDNWNVVPGITDFVNQSTTNVFLAANRLRNDGEILLKAGTPIVKYLPMTEDDVTLKIEVVDDVQKIKIKPFKYFFSNGLTKMMRAKKLNKERIGKCPFHK
jgi:hypothetical protein